MELIEGPSLEEQIESKKGLDPATAAELARQVAVGLSAAHDVQLIHRDIKPKKTLLGRLDPKKLHGGFPPHMVSITPFGLLETTEGCGQPLIQTRTMWNSITAHEKAYPEVVGHEEKADAG